MKGSGILGLAACMAVLAGPAPAAPVQTAQEAPALVGGLDLTRRILRHVDEPGQDVAAYVHVRNPAATADQLLSVSCACADRVELHRIDRSGERPDMVTDARWDVPAAGVLEVRPGSPLHLMLINYDPRASTNGRVRLSLTFREAGTVEAPFALTDDSAAAWAAFD